MEGDAARLRELFRTDAKHRDHFWRDRLNAAFWPTRLGSFTPHVVVNDVHGHACYRLGGDERDGGEAAIEPAGIVDWAIREMVGLVLWPSDEPQPIWEFTLGDVLSYRLYGTSFAPRFWNEPPDDGRAAFVHTAGATLGPPNAEMFPPLVRHVVRRLMKEKLGIRDPRVLLFMPPDRSSRLVFGLDVDGLGGPTATELAFTKIAWCVPSCIPLFQIDRLAHHEAMLPV